MTALLLTLALTASQRAEAAIKPNPPMPRAERAYLACGLADLGTTAIALNQPGLTEGNPLLRGGSDSKVLLKASLLKAGIYGLLKAGKAPPWTYTVFASTQCLAAGWNTYQILDNQGRNPSPTIPMGGPSCKP